MDNTQEINISAIDFATDAMREEAMARGEALGFNDDFLSNFIERELVMMEKWRRRAASEDSEDIQRSDFMPWGGIFD